MSSIAKIIMALCLVGILVLVRAFEEALFYDPLTFFFKSIQGQSSLPEFEMLKLLLNVVLRFLLNTLVSLGVLWVIFQNKDIIKLSGLMYGVLFVTFFAAFCYLLVSKSASNTDNFLSLFYVRRFLIHPILLLVLIPAFYFQKKKR
mgnify:CR=1 FL=1|tara:strand:+ start:1230 stop:1667 length:438 start_codon:yes stop_codon:yes gene_type:complete